MKFRIWDKITKKMWYPEQSYDYSDDEKNLFLGQDGKLYHLYTDTDYTGEEAYSTVQMRLVDEKRYMIMYALDLKDKMGNDLYEKDVVFKFDDPMQEYFITNLNSAHYWIQEGELTSQCKIIGNIYEQKHLFKENNYK